MDPDSAPPRRSAASIGHAIVFELGILLVALAVGWAVGLDPLATIRVDLETIVLGLVATLPPVAALWLLPLLGLFALRRRERLRG